MSSGHTGRGCAVGGAGAWQRPIVRDPHRLAMGALTGRSAGGVWGQCQTQVDALAHPGRAAATPLCTGHDLAALMPGLINFGVDSP